MHHTTTAHLSNTVEHTSANQLPSQSDTSRQDVKFPSADVIRQIPTIAASYEQQSRKKATQGKISTAKKSGRYNTVDIVTVPPHLHWHNEGCH